MSKLLIFKRFDKNNKQIFYYKNHTKILDSDIEYSIDEYRMFYNDLINRQNQHHNKIIRQCDIHDKKIDYIFYKTKFETEINSVDENDYNSKINIYYNHERNLMKNYYISQK